MTSENKHPNDQTPLTPPSKQGNNDSGGIGIDWVKKSQDDQPKERR
ncbi:hypothetical protein ACEUCK_07955 [Aeromonas veronii]|uniref:Uncharacterized protein n=1 Tax=Aeromonas sp. 19NY04SH05-1 TaxID=2920537 RepID=A0AAU6T6K0_9GAMM|nr:hypothetical protein [Aeromonas veronii]